MKKKVLWIEDQASSKLDEYKSKVENNGKYSLYIVLNASDALREIMQNEYDVVIVDIRIDCGRDNDWINCVLNHNNDKNRARLGIVLLKLLFAPNKSEVKIANFQKPKWVNPEKFGVLTVESKREVIEDLDDLGIKFYTQKDAKTGSSTLIDFIEQISK